MASPTRWMHTPEEFSGMTTRAGSRLFSAAAELTWVRSPLRWPSILLNGDVLVLDSVKNNITVFEPTYFGELVRQAFLMYNNGDYGESQELFEEIVRMDANHDWAYVGLGRAYYENGDWEAAKECFRSGVATESYSEVKGDLRNRNLKENFTGIFFGIIAGAFILIVAGKLLAAWLAERRKNAPAEEVEK